MERTPPTWWDPRIPSLDDCVLPRLLERRGAERGDEAFAIFEDGARWSYRHMLDLVRGTATSLARLGVRRGDRVLVWMPNGPDCLRIYLALGYAGAVFVPINTAFRGSALEHLIGDADAELLIADGHLVERLSDVARGSIRRAVALGATMASVGDIEWQPGSVLDPSPGRLIEPVDVGPWDPAVIHYTSGTTGLPKGVLCSHLQLYSMAERGMYFSGENDRFLVNLPLFHIGGTMYVVGSLVKGASLVLCERFRTETFWDTVRSTGATSCLLLGAIVSFLMKQPPSPGDRRHPLRSAALIPLSGEAMNFRQRFGVDVYTFFDMTETPAPLASGMNPTVPGSCGRLTAGFEVRIVDDNDCEVAPGEVGELIVRSDRPWNMASGYFRNPAATAMAWRNGWFHTGDAFRRDEDGNYFFVDRIKDTIRRRGENVSSCQIEAEILAHPHVESAAVVGVASAHSEEDILAVVTPRPGRTLRAEALIEHLDARVPRFMLPRYVRIMKVLPLTETNKVQKRALRAEGVTSDTWDREAARVDDA